MFTFFFVIDFNLQDLFKSILSRFFIIREFDRPFNSGKQGNYISLIDCKIKANCVETTMWNNYLDSNFLSCILWDNLMKIFMHISSF